VLCDAVRKLHDSHCGVNELEIYCGCVATGAIHGAAHGTAYQELFILTIGAFCGTALLAHITETAFYLDHDFTKGLLVVFQAFSLVVVVFCLIKYQEPCFMHIYKYLCTYCYIL
jgi:hypothetical protein